MSGWGPGTPDSPLKRAEPPQEAIEEEDAQSPSEEDQTSSGAQESRQSDIYEYDRGDRRKGASRDLVIPGEYRFLPVFGFNEGFVCTRRYRERTGAFEGIDDENDEPTTIADKELTWWESNSIMPQHPYVLINPVGFTTANADEDDFRDVFRLGKGEQFVFSDSGGYQIMSMADEGADVVDDREEHGFQDLKVHPERLLEWQVRNADAGATLDFPPYNISGDKSFPDAVTHSEDWAEFFAERRDISTDNARRMARRLAELRQTGDNEAEDYMFCPVLQAKPHPVDTHKYVRSWHESIETAINDEGIDADGWVLKPEPAHSLGQIAMWLGYAAEELTDVDYIHVLMVGGLLQKCLLIYYATQTDHFVTSDASSYASGGKRRQFELPMTGRRRSVIITNRDDEEGADDDIEPTRLDRYPCRCQVCATVEEHHGFEFITGGTGSARNATLNLHNLQQALTIERTFDALLREEDTSIVEQGGKPEGVEFWRLISNMATEKRVNDLYDAMGYVKTAINHDLDEANGRYNIEWDSDIGRTIRPIRSKDAGDWES